MASPLFSIRNLGFLLFKLKHVRPNQLTFFHTTKLRVCKSLELSEPDIIKKSTVFDSTINKNKDSYLEIINSFKNASKIKRGHVEFIYASLRSMVEFDVQADITCYKQLMDVFPKGKMIPKNMIQAEFFHFPRHQDCGIDLLDQMETYAVCPDREMKELVLNAFGKSSLVYKKLCRMLYWMPKFKHLNPYALPDPIPSDTEILAELALKKMTSLDVTTQITHYKAENLKDAIDKTWIVSAQSPFQEKLLLKHNQEEALYVEGPFLEWMSRLTLSYFVLRAEPIHKAVIEVDDDDVSDLPLYMFGEPMPKHLTVAPSCVHEQEDATVMAMCATGTSSKDSVLSWIRFLQESNPVLAKIPVLFTFKSPPLSLTSVNACREQFPEDENSKEEEKTKERGIKM